MGYQIEQIEGIAFDWLHEDTILHVKFTTVKRRSLQALEVAMAEIVEHWTSGTFRILIDFSEGNFSPHLRQISNLVTRLIEEKELTGRRAVVVPNGVLGNLVANWAQSVRRNDRLLDTRIFKDTTTAYDWLKSLN